jgi:hypothetical protein
MILPVFVQRYETLFIDIYLQYRRFYHQANQDAAPVVNGVQRHAGLVDFKQLFYSSGLNLLVDVFDISCNVPSWKIPVAQTAVI